MRTPSTEDRLGVLQHYRTRDGRQLRFARPRRQAWQVETEPETYGDFWRAFAVMILILVALAATIVAAVGYAPVPS